MTVAELIEQLRKQQQDAPVEIESDDGLNQRDAGMVYTGNSGAVVIASGWEGL